MARRKDHTKPREGTRLQWIFTIFSYTNDDYRLLKNRLQEHAKYAIVGEEETPTTNRPHLQGYVSLKKRVRFSGIRDIIRIPAHITPARGSAAQNQKYCSKDNKFWEHGTLPRPTRGTSDNYRAIQEAALRYKEALTGHGSLATLYEDEPLIMLQNAWKWQRSHNVLTQGEPPNRQSVIAIWIHGPTGVGKTGFAHTALTKPYVKDSTTIWWCGYEGQRDVIIDEFTTNRPPTRDILVWLQHWPCRVQTKGGNAPLLARRFIITSNFTIDDIYSADPQLPALRRRILEIEAPMGYDDALKALTDFEKTMEPTEEFVCVDDEMNSVASTPSLLTDISVPSTSGMTASLLDDWSTDDSSFSDEMAQPQ